MQKAAYWNVADYQRVSKRRGLSWQGTRDKSARSEEQVNKGQADKRQGLCF